MGVASYQPSDAEVTAIQALPAIQRTLLLYRMDMRAEAAKEWAWATRNFSDRLLLIAAEVARRNEMYDRSINAADRTVQLHDFNLRYPAPYRENMQENLHKHGLEEAWVYGLMRQESRFASKAKSDAGAAGLMQIMPDTARWVARQIGMKGYRKGLIHQLDVNIKLGTFYMKTVSHQFDDNPVLASAAYNAGPTRAKQWCGPQPLEGAIYIETIPFDETRDYVKKVMSNTIYYSKVFGQTSLSLKQRLGTIEAQKREEPESQGAMYIDDLTVYCVGGAVRDKLLGLPVQDHDWVVVGSTPERDGGARLQAGGQRFPGVPASRHARGICAGAHRAQSGAGLQGLHRVCHARGDAGAGSAAPRLHHQRHRRRMPTATSSTPTAAKPT